MVNNAAAPNTKPVSARLARRLAAAADGYRDGRTVWFIARYQADADGSFQISKPMFSQTRPEEPSDPEFGLFGPYKSDRAGPAKRTSIVKIVVHVQNGGDVQEVSFDATDFDAMFWSESALEKFAVPHYVAFEGLENATRLNTGFIKNPAVYLVVHGPNTEYSLHKLQVEKGATAVPPMLISI